MRHYLKLLVFIPALVACGQSTPLHTVPNPALLASAATATSSNPSFSTASLPAAAPATLPTPRPIPVAAPTHATSTTSRGAATQTEAVPTDRNQVTWHGLRFRYNPQEYAFAEVRRDFSRISDAIQAHAVAHLVQTPNRCLGQEQSGSDCFPSEVWLSLYPGHGCVDVAI